MSRALHIPGHLIGDRVRRLRLSAGDSQTEVADETGLSQAIISSVENGRQRLTGEEVSRLAGALGCSPEYLTHTSDYQPVSTRPWLRAYADAPMRGVDQQRSTCELLVETASRLRLRLLPDLVPVEVVAPDDEDGIEALALHARRLAGLDDHAVVGNATRAAERLGCIVVPMHEELGRHVGLSLRIDQSPVICVSRPSEDPERNVPGDRQRLTVLHELGHLALHSTYPPPETSAEAAVLERQAHRFAGAFLIPADALRDEIRRAGDRVTLRTLGAIKERWGISIKALVVRCDELGLLSSKNHARSLYKQISARGWNTREPFPTGNEEALWIRTALTKWANSSDIEAATVSAAAATGLNSSHFRRWMDWSPTKAEDVATVTELHPRADRGQRVADHTGELLLLTPRDRQS